MSELEKNSPVGRRRKLVPKSIWQEQITVDGECLPLDYMLAIVRNPRIDPARRDRMAIAAAPYCHKRLDEKLGKKDMVLIAASSVDKDTAWGNALEPPDTIKAIEHRTKDKEPA